MTGTFLSFPIICLSVHFIFMPGVAKILLVGVVWLPIASMVNAGGIETTSVMTATYKKELMPHADIVDN
jgi:uncharacterized membrane protein